MTITLSEAARITAPLPSAALVALTALSLPQGGPLTAAAHAALRNRTGTRPDISELTPDAARRVVAELPASVVDLLAQWSTDAIGNAARATRR